MYRKFILPCGTALLLALAFTETASAGLVTWSYNFTPTDLQIVGDGGHNQIDLTNQTTFTAIGSSDIVATNLTVHNNLSDTFNGGGNGVSYTLKLQLMDGSATANLAFTGRIMGQIVNGNPTLTNIFDTSGPLTILLNGDEFKISMNSFVGPGPFNPDSTKVVKGGIGFHVDVNGGSGTPPPLSPNDTPEPTSLLLMTLGLGGAGLGAWRKWSHRA